MPASPSHTVVILGDSPGACRALKRESIPVVAVHDEKPVRSIGLADRTFECPPYGPGVEEDHWLKEMASIAGELKGSGRPLLFSASDRGLLAINRHYEALKEHYLLANPPPEIVDTLINKVSFAAWAQEHDIPIPASKILRVGEEITGAGDGLSMPCIVKPGYTFELEETEGVKLFLAETPAEVERFTAICHSKGLDVVLQEDLSRHSSIQWSLAGVSDADGTLLSAVMGEKLRQVYMGAGTAVQTLPMDPKILEIGERFCRETKMPGIFEMEFRPDASGEPKMIEVNPRIWSQVILPAAAGVNLLYYATLTALGQPIPKDNGYRPYYGWISLKRDLRVSLGLLKRGQLSLPEYLRSLIHIRVLD